MPGSPFQKREYREIAVGIGGHIHVEVVTKKVAIPMGIPSPVAVRLRITAFAVTGRTAIFLAVTDPFFSLLCSGADRSAVTGKGQMLGVNQSFLNRTIQELLMIKAKDEKKGDSPVSISSVPRKEEVWKRYWKNHREFSHLSFSLWVVSF